MGNRVVILGGGVAGLSAAHELAERGFRVELHERRAGTGGKARSIPVPGSGRDGRGDLPGEHGFRFFPGFYQNLPDTLKRIPFADNPRGVFNNLVPTDREVLGAAGREPIVMLPNFPKSLRDLEVMFRSHAGLLALGVTEDDLQFFAGRLWQVLTSCLERRTQEYERLPWWKFVDADNRSQAYRDYLAVGLTRTLVAAKAERASTKTIGDIAVQLIFNMITPGETSDRVLNAPTNDAWLDPWVDHLKARGVEFHTGSELESIRCDGRLITGVAVRRDDAVREVVGDYYVAALPVEVMAAHLTDDLLRADPTLAGIAQLKQSVAWMNGVQFYLRDDVPICRGHQMFLDTPWALTSISQAQFWPDYDLARRGDGGVRGILSVDVSDWFAPGVTVAKPASACSREEIAAETWEQMKHALNVQGRTVLTDDNLHSWFVDPDIYPDASNPNHMANAEPLLVNLVGTWPLRPEAHTLIPNLFLASDYVRTFTDLASMEGANEAARRAVNGILAASGSRARPCKVFALHEPDALEAWRLHDLRRYHDGLPWDPSPPRSLRIWALEALIVARDLIEEVGRGLIRLVLGPLRRRRQLRVRPPGPPPRPLRGKDEVAAAPTR